MPLVRAKLPRSTVTWWAACLGLATATALLVGEVVDQAAEARDAFGRTGPVVVATEELQPGQPIGPDAVEVREVPGSMVPDGALTSVPEDRVATAVIVAGEPLVAERVSGPGGRSGPGALLEPGHRAVALPLAGPAPLLEPGDRVDLLSTTAGDDADPLVTDAVVVAPTGPPAPEAPGGSGPEAVTVGVPAGDAPELAASIRDGGVVVALRG